MDIPSTTVITAKTLIDGMDGPPLGRPVIVVEDGKITAVGRQGECSSSEGGASESWRFRKDICFLD